MNEKELNKWLRITLAMVFVLWLAVPITIMCLTKVPANAGEIGDVFGSVNALFTAVAFAFLVYTSLLQREDLRIQMKDFELTRDELKKSAEAQRELVTLTKTQIDNQEKYRRNEVLPIISIDRNRTKWANKWTAFDLAIIFSKKARIFQLEFEPKRSFVVMYPSESRLLSKIIIEGLINLDLRSVSSLNSNESIFGERLVIYFEDIDERKYAQTIHFISDTEFIIGETIPYDKYLKKSETLSKNQF